MMIDRNNAHALNARKVGARSGRDFWRAADGFAAVEFAAIVPIMLLLFFGVLEGSELLTAKRRLTTSANQLADLVAQARDDNDNARMTFAELDILIDNARQNLMIENERSVNVSVYSVMRDPDDPNGVAIHWSRAEDGRPVGDAGDALDDLPDDMIIAEDATLIFVEMDFVYSETITAQVFRRPFPFLTTAVRWPRNDFFVTLCENLAREDTCTEPPR